MKEILFVLVVTITSFPVYGQTENFPLKDALGLQKTDFVIESVNYKGKEGIKVYPPENSTANSLSTPISIEVEGTENFHNGTIEVEIAGNLAKNSDGISRGFVGIAFRVEGYENYEAIYIRPANGRANDQERRNHSVQYISHPWFPWEKLREEFPSRYESYVDLQLGEWTKVKIVVNGSKAELFVHENEQPTLIVNDLKKGADTIGAIALWLVPTSEAHFRNLKVTYFDD